MTPAFSRTAQSESRTLEGKSIRKAHRYPVRTTLRYRITSGELNTEWTSTQTLDMSVGGILMDTREAVPVGSTVELAIDWLGLYHGKPMVLLFVIGSVVRNDRRGTALRILSHQFRDERDAGTPPRRMERNLAVAS